MCALFCYVEEGTASIVVLFVVVPSCRTVGGRNMVKKKVVEFGLAVESLMATVVLVVAVESLMVTVVLVGSCMVFLVTVVFVVL